MELTDLDKQPSLLQNGINDDSERHVVQVGVQCYKTLFSLLILQQIKLEYWSPIMFRLVG